MNLLFLNSLTLLIMLQTITRELYSRVMYVLLKTTCAIALELYTAYVLPYMVTVRFHSCRTRITAVQAIEIENTTYIQYA